MKWTCKENSWDEMNVHPSKKHWMKEQVNDLKPPQWVNQHIREWMIKRLNYWMKATNIGWHERMIMYTEERTNWANKQEIKELHEMKWTWKQTKRNGIKWNEMEMNLKMKKNMNEWINELMSWWMNELMNERTNKWTNDKWMDEWMKKHHY